MSGASLTVRQQPNKRQAHRIYLYNKIISIVPMYLMWILIFFLLYKLKYLKISFNREFYSQYCYCWYRYIVAVSLALSLSSLFLCFSIHLLGPLVEVFLARVALFTSSMPFFSSSISFHFSILSVNHKLLVCFNSELSEEIKIRFFMHAFTW